MHVLVGVHAAPHVRHVPSAPSAHCLYDLELASYMQFFGGIHAAP